MPLIEVLPNSSSVSAPGWAYVPDTGYDPSKAPIQPSGARQRAARNIPVGDGPDLSARQHNAIIKHLADLEKDNYRDVQIPVPSKAKDGAGRERGKVNTAVRRILQSQKTFANHLADEEAYLAPQGPTPTTPTVRTPSQAPPGMPKLPSTRGRRTKSIATKPAATQSQVRPATPTADISPKPLGPASASDPSGTSSVDEVDPLWRTYTPLRPPEALLDQLLAAPALPYSAARSKPSTLGHPKRRFCEICGYWGRIKCIKCGARVCGLECKGVHDEQRCLRFYA